MSEPLCCGGPMWLTALVEVEDRGGRVLLRGAGMLIPVDDALVWECLECDNVKVIVTT